MNNKKFCVFCGAIPDKKNREHILPQWLLKMTGNPKRVVNFGINYETSKTIRFDWSNFVVPSCEKCNTKYSDMEVRAKEYVERILEKDALSSREYIDFMDWLDKVRIGVWIAYHLIQKNPTKIQPKFHINTRISTKDRMIAIYPAKADEKGLNTFGVESFIFHCQPSCFGLKINNILILNMSSDYLFASRCGFPYPQQCKLFLDGKNKDMMRLGEFKISHKIEHPLIEKNIIKPCIHLYQPIMQKADKKIYPSGFLGDYSLFDSFLAQHTIQPYPTGKGILFFQHQNKVEPIFELDAPIHFQEIKKIEAKPVFQLISQVYEFQNYIFEKANKKTKFMAKNNKLIQDNNERARLFLEWNHKMINYFKEKIKS